MSSRLRATLHVAHVIRNISIEAAGTTYTVPAMCDALGRQGARVELHVLEAGPEGRYSDVAYALHVHRRSLLLTPVEGSSAMQAVLATRAGELDVLHGHGLWRMPNLYAASAARRGGKRFVLAPRGMLEPSALQYSKWQKHLFWALGQGSAILSADCLHATSEGELESIRRLGLTNPVAVIANGIHIPSRSRQRSGQGVRTLLYLGRLHPIKALDRLVEAWSQLERRHTDWALRLVGPSEAGHEGQLKEQCARLGLQRVSFADGAFGAEKDREFEAAHLFVLPSHSENFGMTVAEALACGVPVLASRGTPWAALEQQACGAWVENSVSSLAAALDRLLGLPAAELDAMGQRGRSWMERDFSWTQKAEQLLGVYDWLLGRAADRPAVVDAMKAGSVRGNRTLGARRAPW